MIRYPKALPRDAEKNAGVDDRVFKSYVRTCAEPLNQKDDKMGIQLSLKSSL